MSSGNNEQHKPVLLAEVIEGFSVFREKTDLVYYDGTYGRGGHFREIFSMFGPKLCFITDQDPRAIEVAHNAWQSEVELGKIQIFYRNFMDFSETLSADTKFDMVLLDLGVSSPQLDDGSRGFSFNKNGPLDMRMNPESSLTAAQIVNTFEADDLVSIFKEYGEIENPSRVVRAIVQDRAAKEFSDTLSLAGLIERVDGWRKKGFHPATQYFMALRLVVNRELEVVEKALPQLISHLRDQGRISVITFHSLEDRIVKRLFKESLDGFLVNKKVIVPSEEECKINPRARSAKLRIFQKGKPEEKPDKFAMRRAQRG